MPDPRRLPEREGLPGLTSDRCAPHRARARAAAIAANRGIMARMLSEPPPVERGAWCGQPCTVVANGPSAARAVIRGRVIAINGALALVSQADIWMVADPLSTHDGQDVRAYRELAPRARILAACHWSSPALTIACPSILWWLPAIGGPYGAPMEEMLEESITGRCLRLLLLSEGATAALHLAWWLGASEIHLYGLEHCRAAGEQWHAALPGASEQRGDLEIETPVGPRLTTPEALVGHAQLSAVCSWIGDYPRGIPIYDQSGGLPLAGTAQRAV